MAKALYPGSFDPFTLGHLDIVERAASIFDSVCIVLAVNTQKQPLLADPLRQSAIEKATTHLANVSVHTTSKLIVDFAKQQGACVLIRACRNSSDLDLEQQLCAMNRALAPEIETLLLIPDAPFQNISSSIVREILRLDGNTSAFLPPAIAQAYQAD